MEHASNEIRIRSVLGRLETIIDNENDNIGHDPDFDLPTSNAHKSRCLYELAMLTRDVRPEEVPASFSPQLGRVREKLGDFKGALAAVEQYLKLMSEQGEKPAWSNERIAELRRKAGQ